MEPRIKTCRFKSDRFFSVDHLLNSAVLVHHVPCNPVIDAQQSCRFPKANNFTVKRNSDCALLILRLLFGCFPLAVTRFVVPIVIDSVNRVSWWRFSHIGQKLFEIVKPLVADFNSSVHVAFKSRAFRIVASVFHATPNPICASSAFAVCAATCACEFCLKASAASSMVFRVPQVTTVNRPYCAASALAHPSDVPSFFNTVLVQDFPSSKFLSG